MYSHVQPFAQDTTYKHLSIQPLMPLRLRRGLREAAEAVVRKVRHEQDLQRPQLPHVAATTTSARSALSRRVGYEYAVAHSSSCAGNATLEPSGELACTARCDAKRNQAISHVQQSEALAAAAST